jgi:iron uptake system component EfeO
LILIDNASVGDSEVSMGGRLAASLVVAALILSGCTSAPGEEPSSGPVSPETTVVTRKPAVPDEAYRSYIRRQAATMRRDGRAFTAAVRSGDRAAARRLYPRSRAAWHRIEPVAASAGELARRLDAAATGDPQVAGWHCLERLLWGPGCAAGAGPAADALDAGLAELERYLSTVAPDRAQVAAIAVDLVETALQRGVTGASDPLAGTGLTAAAANVAGARAAWNTLGVEDPRVTAAFHDAEAALAAGRPRPDTGEHTARRLLVARLGTLAERLAAARIRVGVR